MGELLPHTPIDRIVSNLISGAHRTIADFADNAGPMFDTVHLGADALLRLLLSGQESGQRGHELKTNVYSPAALTDRQAAGIAEGLSRFGAVADISFITEYKRVKLPVQADGAIEMSRVGMRKLDPGIPLHLFAIPKGTRHKRGILGEAISGLGIAYIDLCDQGREGIASTVAHEGAHALGFLDRKPVRAAADEREKFMSHCENPFCVMHPESAMLRHDFCDECETEIKGNINKKLYDLAANRVVSRRVSNFAG